jgi:hypothetical protein
MKFRNPWIDPRVTQVRSAAAQAYLRQHGWRPLPPEQPHLLPFTAPAGAEDGPTLRVPLLEQARDYTQRVIDLITDLALAEGRYAVAVLDDILRQPPGDGAAPGPAVPAQTQPATR